MRIGQGKNLKYIAGIILLICFGAFTWWIRLYVVPQLSVFSFIVLEYAAGILALSAFEFGVRANLKYIAGIVVLTGLAAFISWVQQYVLQQMTGAQQLAAFLYFMIGFGVAILGLNALRFRVRANSKYLTGIVALGGFGAITWYAQEYVAPQLGVFFGFLMAYAAAVLALFYILGRYGG